MANIFSGMFGGGNSSAANAQYQQQLDEYNERREAAQQLEAIKNMDPRMKTVMEDISNERGNQMLLQRAMAMNPATFDKGMEGITNSLKQRGTTIADIQKQKLATKEANARHKYKVDNPVPGSLGANLEYANAYIEASPEDRKLMDAALGRGDLVDQGTFYYDSARGIKYPKNLAAKTTEVKAAENRIARLKGYQSSKNTAESSIAGLHESMLKLKGLREGVGKWGVTGVAAYATQNIPTSPARDWGNNMDTVNAQTVIDTMKELKSLSPSGATGFGAVNIAELEAMMNRWGKIDQFASDEQINSIIDDRERIMTKIMERMNKAYKEENEWYERNRGALPEGQQDVTPGDITIEKGVYNPETGEIEWQ